MENPYEILGVSKDASREEIRKAFKKKAQEHHPDREGGSHEKMMALTVANRILTNAEQRERYDRTGSTSNEPSIDELAYRKITEAFNEIFEENTDVGFQTQDPVKAVISAAIKGRREVIRRMKHLMKQRKYVQTAIHRLVKNAERVTPIFQGFIDAVPARLKMAEKEVTVIERAIEMLRDVEYETRDVTQHDVEWNERERMERLKEMQRITAADYDPDDDKEFSWSWTDWNSGSEVKGKKKRKKKGE